MPEPLLSVRDLKVHFKVRDRKAWPWTPAATLKAVVGVSFDRHAGETLGIVGESGCGKSTLARACLNLIPATGGEVVWAGKTLRPDDHAAWSLTLRGADRLARILREQRADATLYRTLATLRTDCPIPWSPAELAWRGVDRPALAAVCAEIGLDPATIRL